MQSEEWRKFVLSRPFDPRTKNLYEKYQWKEKVQRSADDLYKRVGDKGAEWSECVMAAKKGTEAYLLSKYAAKKTQEGSYNPSRPDLDAERNELKDQ